MKNLADSAGSVVNLVAGLDFSPYSRMRRVDGAVGSVAIGDVELPLYSISATRRSGGLLPHLVADRLSLPDPEGFAVFDPAPYLSTRSSQCHWDPDGMLLPEAYWGTLTCRLP